MKQNQKILKNIWVYYVFSFLQDAVLIGAALIPFYKDWGGISQTQIQTLQSIFMVSIFLMEVPTGVIADMFGRKTSLIIGAIFPTVALMIYTLSPNFILFVVGEFLFAIGIACMSGANTAIVYDSLKQAGKEDQAKKIMTRSQSFHLAGIMTGGLLGSFLLKTLNLEPVMIWKLSTIPMGLSIIAGFFFKEPDVEQESEEKKWLTVLKKGVDQLFKNRELKFITADMIIISVCAYFVVWLYQVKLGQIGVPDAHFGVYNAVLTLTQILLLAAVPWIEKVVGERNYFWVSALLTAGGFVLAGVFRNFVGAAGLILIAGGFGLPRRNVYDAQINKHIKSSERATTNSSIGMLRSLAIAAVNPLVGALSDWNLNTTFLILGAVATLGTVFSYKIMKRIS